MDILSIFTSFLLSIFNTKPVKNVENNPQVLAASTESQQILDKFTFNVQSPAFFFDTVTFSKDLVAPNVVYSFNGEKGDVTYELTAGNGITIDGTKITNTLTQGITSLVAGTNISIDGNEITNTYEAPTINYALSGWTKTGTSVTLTTTTDSVTVGGLTAGAVIADSLTTSGLALAGGLTVTSGNSLLPDTDLGSDIGSAAKRFNNLWVANINSNSSQAFSGQSTFSYAPTDATITQGSVIINPTASAADGQLLGLGIGGYQRALIDEDGDITLGYNSLTSAPASDYPLNVYGHNGTRVSFVDTTGSGYFAGNVGIGTSSPTSYGAGYTTLAINGTTTGVTDWLSNGIRYGTAYVTGGAFVIGSATTGNLQLLTNNSAKLTIVDATGNVGIGTTGPSTKLQINQTADSNALKIYGFDDVSTSYGDLYVDASGYTNLTSNSRLYLGATYYTLFTYGGTAIAWLNGTSSMDFFDNKSLNWGNDNDFRILYDETTDDQLEMSDGTNLFLSIKDQGTTSDFAFNVDDFFIKNDGNVGIGTTGPTSKLHVSGAVTGKALSIFDETGDQALITASASGVTKFTVDHNGKVSIASATNPNSRPLFVNANSDSSIGISIGGDSAAEALWIKPTGLYSNARNITFAPNAVTLMTLTTGGNVGIGTTSPTSKLHVSGAVTGKALSIFDETGDQALLTASASGVTKFVIDHSGNVGVGTITPAGMVGIQTSSASAVGLSIKASASQSANNFEVRNSSNALLFGVGGLYGGLSVVGTASGTSTAIAVGSNQSAVSYWQGDGSIILGNSSVNTVGMLDVYPKSASGIGIIVKGLTSQSGNLQQWRDSAGNPMTVVTSDGSVGIGLSAPGAKLQVSGQTQSVPTGIVGSTYQVNSVNYGSLGANTGIGFVGSNYYSTPANLPTNPLGNAYAVAGLVGIGGGSSGGAYGIGVFGYGQTTGGNMTGGTAGGKFVADIKTTLNLAETLYGLQSTANGTGSNTGSDTVYGLSSTATGGTGDVTYGGYFTASGGTTNYGIYSANGTNYFSENVGLGTTTFGTSAAKVLAIAGSTAPTTGISDGIQLYAVDAAGSHELKVMDEAGNATTLSPHNFSLITDGPSEEMAWSYYSERDGLAVNVDMTKALRIVEGISGEKLIVMKDLNSGLSIEPTPTPSTEPTKFDVLNSLILSIKDIVTNIETKITAFADKFRTKELCLGEENNETCVTKAQLDELIKLLPTPTVAPTTSSEPVIIPEVVSSATPSATPIPEASSSATIE